MIVEIFRIVLLLAIGLCATTLSVVWLVSIDRDRSLLHKAAALILGLAMLIAGMMYIVIAIILGGGDPLG